MTHQNEPLIVGYAEPGVSRQNRLATWLAKTPLWLLAIVILMPVLICEYSGIASRLGWRAEKILFTFLFFAALFTPGALRRLNWRHVLVLLSLAGICCVLDTVLDGTWQHVPFPYSDLVWAAAPVLIAGLGEWFLLHPRSRRALLCILLLSIAVGCLIPLIYRSLDFTDVEARIPRLGGGFLRTSWGSVVRRPLFAVLAWVAIPVGLALGQESTRTQRLAVAGIAAASASLFVLFFHVVIYHMARTSLAGDGPFGRNSASAILDLRGNEADSQAVWTAIERADWSKPHNYLDEPWDYRRRFIDFVAKHDREAAGKRLAQLLKNKTSRPLASYSAALLAEQRRYDVVPVLTRYAMLGEAGCTEALEAMNVPEAAVAIMHRIPLALSYDAMNTFATFGGDFALAPADRTRFARLLAHDAGPNLSDWTSYYDAMLDQLPTPLSKDDASETRRVTQAFLLYWRDSDKLYRATCRLYVRRVEQDGKGEYLAQLRALEPSMRKQQRPSEAEVAAVGSAAIHTLEGYWQKASADMSVPKPNWDVPSTEALEREVAEFGRRVNATIARHGVSATAPSTMPTAPGALPMK